MCVWLWGARRRRYRAKVGSEGISSLSAFELFQERPPPPASCAGQSLSPPRSSATLLGLQATLTPADILRCRPHSVPLGCVTAGRCLPLWPYSLSVNKGRAQGSER